MKLLFLLLLLLPTACTAEAPEQTMTLYAINVGKADCLLLRSGQSAYLIDTGRAETWGAVSAALRQLGVTELDGVIVTHTDQDHSGGAWALAQSSVKVKHWYASKYYADVKESKHPVIKAAALRNEAVVWLAVGDVLPLDGGSLTVLGPVRPNKKENNNSAVLLAQTAAGSILLTGDMEEPEETELLAAGLITPCTVLKVGNHGENDATTAALVSVVKPQIAVISTNTMEEPDTPAPRVMKLLAQAGAQTAVTQDAPSGLLVTVADGRARVDAMALGAFPMEENVRISGKNAKKDEIRLINRGDRAVELTDWFIRSERGGEVFVFPAGATIAPGQELAVISRSGDEGGDFVWPDKKVWHPSKEDMALLFDADGRLVDQMD